MTNGTSIKTCSVEANLKIVPKHKYEINSSNPILKAGFMSDDNTDIIMDIKSDGEDCKFHAETQL